MHFIHFQSSSIDEAIDWINRQSEDALCCITGGKAQLMSPKIKQKNQQKIEFQATCQGAEFLIRSMECTKDFILTNVGTGTSIHYVNHWEQVRIGGTGIGGGTLRGLGFLLTDISDYDELINRSIGGSREEVDLKVGDIYEGMTPPIPADLTASNFGKACGTCQYKEQDLLASVVGLVAETVTTLSLFASSQYNTKDVVFVGSSFVGNPLLKQIVKDYSELRGLNAMIPEYGEYSGAIGCFLSLISDHR